MKTNDSSQRLKLLMRRQSDLAASSTPSAPAAVPPLVVAPMLAQAEPAMVAIVEPQKSSWDRVTIRLTAGELQKINDVVIATQQANRRGKVTTTDILRVALLRVKDREAFGAAELQVLRAKDGRSRKGNKVRPS